LAHALGEAALELDDALADAHSGAQLLGVKGVLMGCAS
jgi:hypothetical protein